MLQKGQKAFKQDIVPIHTTPDEETALLPNAPERPTLIQTIRATPRKAYHSIREIWNAPLTGALFAILIGLIPPIKNEFYGQDRFFYRTITTSLINLGELFTALMLFILGANLQINSQGDQHTPIHVLVYIYVMRFILMPLIGILVVWKVSAYGWLDDSSHLGLGGDPMLKLFPFPIHTHLFSDLCCALFRLVRRMLGF
jgi:hypothetical protein